MIKILNADKLELLTRKESEKEVPNYWIKNLKLRIADRQITQFTNPYPQLEGVTKEKVRYKRADGVDLTGDLYLPKGYNKSRDGKLPVLFGLILLNTILQPMLHRFVEVNISLHYLTGVLLFITLHKAMLY